jgi:hypothetical protein
MWWQIPPCGKMFRLFVNRKLAVLPEVLHYPDFGIKSARG